MKKLPKTLTKDGFTLTLIKRQGRTAIYKQSRKGMYHVAYEVIIPNVYNRDFNGAEVEPYESYPGAGEWGRKGWTFLDSDKANNKLEEINESKNDSSTKTGRDSTRRN